MPNNKEILKVELDTTEFDAFKKAFDSYSDAVKALPGEWQKSGTEIAAHKTQFEEMADSIRSQAEEAANLVTSQGKAAALFDTSAIALVGMAKSGRQFAGHIFQATASLRHWSKLTALFGGLIGAGGLFGISRMAMSVAGQRTSAVGLGVTYGERASFLANFGRLGNAEGLLRGFSEAETDVSKKYALRQYLGHGESGDPARDFAEGLGRFKDLVDRTPKELLGPALRQRGYDKLPEFDTETALSVKGMSRGEIEQIGRGYGADLATRLGLAPDVSKKWTEFTTRIEKAGEDIDTILWKGTSKLTKPLEDLSLGFEHLVSSLFRDGSPISGWIKDLGVGLQEFADTLGSRAAQRKAAQLGSDVAAVARLLEAIVATNPRGLAVLIGTYEAAKWLGGPAVAIGEALAGSALGTGAAAAVGAGAVGVGMNKLMPQHPERLRRGQEYENAGGSPTSPHPAMTRAHEEKFRPPGATPSNAEDERARQERFRKGDWQGPLQPDALGPWQGPMQPARGPWQGPPMPKGVFPKMEPAKPGSLSDRSAVGFDKSEATGPAPSGGFFPHHGKRGNVSSRAFYNSLVAQGMTPVAAAAVTGNAAYESGSGRWDQIVLDPATDAGVKNWGTGDAAVGANQWEGVRKRGVGPSFHSQTHHIIEELQRGGAITHGLTLKKLNAMKNVRAAAAAVNQRYERPRHPWASMRTRQNYAAHIYDSGTHIHAIEPSSQRHIFGHRGHHPATVGRTAPQVEVQDNTGGMVAIEPH